MGLRMKKDVGKQSNDGLGGNPASCLTYGAGLM